jgi:hypothetical protein
MRTPMRIVLLLCFVTLVAGCPFDIAKYDFTNADLSYSSYRDGIAPTGGTADVANSEGQSAER